ncbi:4,5-DOPA dioxygenase extradiol [Sinobacterium caligoides]|uniref:4,5-DOPA dioxygenase extradiol n=1 Tax=Sinobacterium caligoides TaxID=933926 RepID=A0A3N2DY61_9GAMM|nr:class III extradiol ring-cleavage dioxygenase [Sinobacterium caligoides]ROS04800.1 4,5-DOPA dioxygenase extradiol [Sinobacterium caligoides]
MTNSKYPLLFLAHGSPMNAIEDNPFSRDWHKLYIGTPSPKAVIVISAHWESNGTYITHHRSPPTLHDFSGFPAQLNQLRYACPGAPILAEEVHRRVPSIQLDQQRGLDHGCWSLMNQLFPRANIPTLQISLNRKLSPQQHWDLAKQLKWLRQEEVLILCSGNIVHNIAAWQAWMSGNINDVTWAGSFDKTIYNALKNSDTSSLIHYSEHYGSELSVPTAEHYLPLIYADAIRDKKDPLISSTPSINSFEASCSRSIRFG